MRILDRYIIKEFLMPFLYCIVIFTFLYIIIDLFGHLDEILKNHVSLKALLAYYGSYIPIIFVQTTPFAVLVATIFIISTLVKHNEIIAMRASGISLFRILRPFLFLGALISIVVFLVNDNFVPRASVITSAIKEEQIEKNKTPAQGTVIENVAIYGMNNRMIYARSYEADKMTLKKVIILEQDGRQQPQHKITADEGRWLALPTSKHEKGKPAGRWKFYNCFIYSLDKSGQVIGKPAFYKKKMMKLDERPADFLRQEYRTDYMNHAQLKGYIKRLAGTSRKTLMKLEVDLHYKFALPFISFIIVLVGMPFALKTNRGGALVGVGLSIAIGLFYYGGIAISLAFGKAGYLPPLVAAWFANILFATYGIFMLTKTPS